MGNESQIIFIYLYKSVWKRFALHLCRLDDKPTEITVEIIGAPHLKGTMQVGYDNYP
jgi:hypothetical protein